MKRFSAALVAGVVSLLLTLAACSTNPVTGESQLVLISEEQEVALGKLEGRGAGGDRLPRCFDPRGDHAPFRGASEAIERRVGRRLVSDDRSFGRKASEKRESGVGPAGKGVGASVVVGHGRHPWSDRESLSGTVQIARRVSACQCVQPALHQGADLLVAGGG